MPVCASPIADNRYNKYNSITGEYTCELCPPFSVIQDEILNSSPIEVGITEESFRQILEIGSNSNDPLIGNKYGDLLINLDQCKNYIDRVPELGGRSADIAREMAQSEKIVDSGTWEILNNITQDEIDSCNSRIQSDRTIDQNRICEILSYYKNSNEYLTGERLNSAIRSQFGIASSIENDEISRRLPPLPNKYGGGSTIMDYKNAIHQERGRYIAEQPNILTYLNLNNDPPSSDKILLEEIYDFWIEVNRLNGERSSDNDILNAMNMRSLFEGEPSSVEFELCMNNIFDSKLNNRYLDNDIQESISRHKDITELRSREIDYIEDKLKIISTIESAEAMECMNILNIGEMICDKGVSDRMLKMGYLVMHIIGLDKMNLEGIQRGTIKYQKLKHILDRLTPYIRSAVKNIIQISKYYELQTCGYESASTHILETIYYDVFEKTKEVDINIQGLNLIPNHLIKETSLMEFAKTIILLIVMIAGIYVLMVILNRPVEIK